MAIIYSTLSNNLAILTWLGATRLLAATLKLFNDNTSVNQDTDPATLHPPTFTGYTTAVLTWQTPSVASGNQPELVSDDSVFRATDAVSPDNAYGAFVQNALTGTTLEYIWNFDNAPIPFPDAHAQLLVNVRVRITNNRVSAIVTVY